MYKFTVFTPTFNRADLLKLLYGSLLEQNFKDFEWLIVDDGSTDDTKIVIENFSKENKISINYIFQENQGKHVAINNGLKNAKGFLFFIVDSDDILINNSLEILSIRAVKLSDKIVGLVGMRGFKSSNKTMVKNFGKKEIVASSLEFTYVHRYNEEVAICVETSIAKRYLFPEVKGEKFCPESLLWNRLSIDYQFYYFNELIYFGDYLENGLSDHYFQNIEKSYQTSVIYFKELLNYRIVPEIVKINAVKTIVSLSRKSPNRILFLLKNVKVNYLLKYFLSKI